ncbi:MAG: PilZ domain-containing protein [Candidatus Acidiferrales bacterium]
MYPVVTSQIAPRPDERRRSPRHPASAIVYVHFGPENGGIVINLGINGLACQTARKLHARENTILNVRLRGSGLDVNLAGEIVWQGATQKEIGIRFNDPTTSQQQDIAKWIAQQDQASKAPPLDNFPPPKSIPGRAGGFAAGQRFIPHPLSGALATPQPKPADPPLSAPAAAIAPRLPAPANSPSGISAATPELEVVSPIKDFNVSSDGPDARTQGRKANSIASPEPYLAGQPLYNRPRVEPPQNERARQASTGNATPIGSAKEPMPTVLMAAPRAPTETSGKTAIRKTEEIKPITPDRVSSPPVSLPAVTAAERWIPPALLVAWRQGNQQQKIVLAAVPTACLLILVLVFSLAVGHFESSSRQSAEGGFLQQSIARPAASSVSADSAQVSPFTAPPDPSATPQSQADPPSLLDRFAETFLGYKPVIPEVDTYLEIPIDKNHVSVQVWTSKSSGYYYCTDSPYYMMMLPGAVMAQRDALQSGYQPKLGQFCN